MLTAFGNYLDSILPFGKVILTVLNVVVSLPLISFLFAAIYKVLPDRELTWRDVAIGAVVTAILFTVGKSLIGWYIGSSAVASSFGAAGALIVLLLWVYYSAQIFLLGAEFTKVYVDHRGGKQDGPTENERGRVTAVTGGSHPERIAGGMTDLLLKRSRIALNEVYDVICEGRIVGRMMLTNAPAPYWS